ncbi:MAG: isoleucine--tRNA ligase [Syntrophomonadaceae bacterium]|nr:isoleucine--tRNA ligase [Syntrophomonadaceae bacterium]
MAKGRYDETLNLMKTDFPMRANLPKKEPEILKFWDDIDIYRMVEKRNQGNTKFVLHDGPPYANGHIHLGHALNKILKDIIVKFFTGTGADAPYVPGWDTHGLPIEQQAIKALGIDRHHVDVVEFRRYCRDYALKYIDIQRQEFIRLGIRGDWDNPYLTLAPHFEAEQIGVFGAMANKGYIYKGLKTVYWCCDCETALAEAEIEYAEKNSDSIYVKFPLIDANELFQVDNTYVVIWTTTPWTLPANAGITLHPEFTYGLVQVGQEKYVIAVDLIENVASELGWTSYQVLEKFQGAELEEGICRHPFIDRESLIICGEHVTLEQGTGCVHTAPGHGADDFEIGKAYGLPILSPLDGKGIFTAEAGKFEGLFCNDANSAIIQEIAHQQMLLSSSQISHQYPHCWRCKNPIIFRATEQWFASIEGFRQDILDSIDQVKWIPAWGRDRIFNMVRDRGDWCISRQRTWGVPIPIFYCNTCNKTVINDETIANIKEIFSREGSEAWFARSAEELLPSGFVCPDCGGKDFTKETDTMDVWFDSGSSHLAVLEGRPELRWPADLYLEGSDQHRGWFNSSLTTSVAVRGVAPYRAVLTHGFVVDEQGRKQSKSQGNVVDPLDIAKNMGADILRLWVSSVDYRTDVSASDNIMKQLAEAYRKIRNTCRFILGNLYDYDPVKNRVSFDDMNELDRWALLKLNKLIARVTKAYENYEFHVVYHGVHNFCTVDMSSVYLDIIKDRLYTNHKESQDRRAAQTVMTEVIQALVRILAPILAFTSEEIWQYLRADADPISVQLAGWPTIDESKLDSELEAKWEGILKVREVVAKSLEEARRAKVIGHSLNAHVLVSANDQLFSVLQSMGDLDKIFIVSEVLLVEKESVGEGFVELDEVPGVKVKVEPARGEKCERCWVYSPTVGQDAIHNTLCDRCLGVING